MRTRLRSGVVAVTLIVTSTLGGAMLMGAQGSLRGDERGVWTDDRTSVVIAKLKAVRQKGEPGQRS